MSKGRDVYLQYSNPSAVCAVPVTADGDLDPKAVLGRDLVTL